LLPLLLQHTAQALSSPLNLVSSCAPASNPLPLLIALLMPKMRSSFPSPTAPLFPSSWQQHHTPSASSSHVTMLLLSLLSQHRRINGLEFKKKLLPSRSSHFLLSPILHSCHALLHSFPPLLFRVKQPHRSDLFRKSNPAQLAQS
jgi:hypothetical protein